MFKHFSHVSKQITVENLPLLSNFLMEQKDSFIAKKNISSISTGIILPRDLLIKPPRFENLSKSPPIVHMKILSPDSDLAPKL